MFSGRAVFARGRTGLALLLLAIGVACSPVERPRLPPVAHYGKLPPQFAQALEKARQAADQTGPTAPEAVRRLARLYHANGLLAEAKACYRVVAAEQGGLSAQDHYCLADIAHQGSDLATAQAELDAVLKAEPSYLPAHLLRAAALFKSGQEDAASAAYAAILQLESNQPDAVVGLARLDLQQGRDDAAVARLEKLLVVHPDAVAGAALLAKILERRGDAGRAVALTQWSQQKPGLPPADPWLDALMADCYDVQRLSLTFEEYFKQGRMEAATPLLDRLAVLDPTGPITKMFAGVSHAKALEHITAVREYYAALGQGGDPEKICPYLVQSLLAIGNVAEAESVAAGYYHKASDSIPLAKAYADVVLRLGDNQRARPLLEKILAKEPYLQAQNMSLARIHWDSGDRAAAVPCLQRVALAFPHDVASRALLAEYYLGQADPFAAIKLLEPVSDAAPAGSPVRDNLRALLGTGYLQAAGINAEKGKLEEAAEQAAKAVDLRPRDLDACALQADLCVRLKRFQPAAEALARMAALQPGNPTIHLSWGDVLYQGGDAAQANRQWQQAMQSVPPGADELRQALRDRLEGKITPATFQ
ncbi:MAG TPA: tetratricopeptide repeat protein [Lacunisphaera sp.]|nr:tetratricopeptide repeat protein [Lacunisphaera sp.]